MINKLFLLFLSITLIKNSSCLNRNFSPEVSHTLKEILAKWENKELQLNIGCAEQLYQLLENLFRFDDGFWAYKMIDASAKIPSGLLEGNFGMMGNFDQCLNIKSQQTNVTGNYCLISANVGAIDVFNDILHAPDQIQDGLLTHYKKLAESNEEGSAGQPTGTKPVFSVCLPNKCSADDLSNMLYLVAQIIPLNIRCQTKEEMNQPLDTGAIVTIIVFGVIIAMMILSTLYDYYYRGRKEKSHKILIAFSIYTNGKKLFRMHTSQGDLSCLHGIRFLSMCWVILGHTYLIGIFGPTVNLLEMFQHLSNSKDSMVFLNCALAVDSFFVLSGLLVAYNFIKKMKKGENFNIFKYYIHRYLRLTPAYAAVILATSYLFNYVGSGPLYYKLDVVVGETCRRHWWKALLYLQNYLVENDLCIPQSWNLSIDWQLYLLSPIFLFILFKTPKFGTLITIVPIIGCMTAGFVVTYQNNLSSFLAVNGKLLNFMTYYYYKTHTRAATWFIGLWLGYVLGRIKFYNDTKYLKIQRAVILIIWLVVLTVIPVCVFAGQDMIGLENYNVIKNSMYNSLVRPTWALCISWIIFACTIGYGGIINDFLSLPIFGLLSKFTYSMYLLHLPILDIMLFSRKVSAYFSIPGLLSQFSSLFALTFGLSVFWILAFEMPILVIEPYVFGTWETPSKKKSQVAKSTDNIEKGPQ